MKKNIVTFILLIAPIFYQLDYRQRIGVEVSIPGLAGFELKKSFETRYRPLKKDASLSEINPSIEWRKRNLSVQEEQFSNSEPNI
jgi:hypothetical protein